MKIICALLVLLPALASAAPEKRFFMDDILSQMGFISLDVLKQDVQMMLDVIGSEPSEQACEQEGHKLLSDGLVQHAVPLICRSFQTLVQQFHLVPDTTTASVAKRFFLDSFNNLISTDVLKQDLQVMLDLLGSDPSEQACEQEGHKLFGDGLIQHSIPLICHSFQELIHHFQLVPDTTTASVV